MYIYIYIYIYIYVLYITINKTTAGCHPDGPARRPRPRRSRRRGPKGRLAKGR